MHDGNGSLLGACHGNELVIAGNFAAVVDHDHRRCIFKFAVFDLLFQAGIFLLVACKRRGVVVPARHAPQHDDDFSFDIDALEIVVIGGVGNHSVAREHHLGSRLAAGRSAEDLKVGVHLELDRLTDRSFEGNGACACAFGFGSAEPALGLNGEGLEPGPVLAGRLESGLRDLADDVLGGLVDPLGADVAAFALRRGEVEDVLLHALLDDIVLGKARRRGEDGEADNRQYAPQRLVDSFRH